MISTSNQIQNLTLTKSNNNDYNNKNDINLYPSKFHLIYKFFTYLRVNQSVERKSKVKLLIAYNLLDKNTKFI